MMHDKNVMMMMTMHYDDDDHYHHHNSGLIFMLPILHYHFIFFLTEKRQHAVIPAAQKTPDYLLGFPGISALTSVIYLVPTKYDNAIPIHAHFIRTLG